MKQVPLKMSVDATKKVTWNRPRSSEPFILNLFGATFEKLFRVGDEDEKTIADCSEGSDMTVKTKPGTYNVVGGDFVNTNYINIIEVSAAGEVTEEKFMVDQVHPSSAPSHN